MQYSLTHWPASLLERLVTLKTNIMQELKLFCIMILDLDKAGNSFSLAGVSLTIRYHLFTPSLIGIIILVELWIVALWMVRCHLWDGSQQPRIEFRAPFHPITNCPPNYPPFPAGRYCVVFINGCQSRTIMICCHQPVLAMPPPAKPSSKHCLIFSIQLAEPGPVKI